MYHASRTARNPAVASEFDLAAAVIPSRVAADQVTRQAGGGREQADLGQAVDSIGVQLREVFQYSPGQMNFVGIGYDVHAFAEGRKLYLGGVEIPHSRGLEGHSDADVVMHAICDAVLGALGAGDIGTFFPNTDPRWKGVPSRTFLEEAARQVASRKGEIVNVDCTVLAQEPRIAPHVQAMKKRVAEALRIDPVRVGIKATTNENMGFIGRGEGIAAMAVASVEISRTSRSAP